MTIHIARFVPLVVLAFAAMFAVDAGPAHAGGGCRGNPSTSASGSQVRMTGYACFTPTVLYAEAGTTVTWTNETDELHDVAGATLEWGDYSDIRGGESTSFQFDRAGTYPYYCFVHPGMTGAIVVGDGRTTAAAVQSAAPAPAVPVEARVASGPGGEGDPPAPLGTSTVAGSSGESNPLLFAALGGLAGGAVVAVGFGVRGFRRR